MLIEFIGSFLIAVFVLLAGANAMFGIYEFFRFYARLFTGRLTIKEMRERHSRRFWRW